MKRIKGIPLRFTRNSLVVAMAIASGILDEEQRYFTDLTPAGGQYYDLGDGYILTGNFDVSLKFVPDGLTRARLLGERDAISSYLRYEGDVSNDIALVLPGGSGRWTTSLEIGQLNTLRLVRSGSNTELFVNEVSVGVEITGSGDWVIELIGTGNLFNYTNGIISDVIIEDNGTLVGDYPLDEDWTQGNVAVNRAAVLGSELFSNPSLGSNWTDNGSGSYSTDGTVQGDLFVSGVATIGQSYLYEITVDSITSGTIRLRVGDSAGSFYDITATGKHFVVLEAEIVNTTVRALVGTVATISGISLKQIPSTAPYATATNITNVDATERRRDNNFSPNRWVNINDTNDYIEIAGT